MTVYVDLNRCIGCKACEVACKRVHDAKRITVEVVDDRAAVPLSCRQCLRATCTTVCHAGALVRVGGVEDGVEDGDIVFHADMCTGCGLCALACPFGLIYETVDRCDLCVPRDMPACVQTCPSEALIYGEDPGARTRKRAAKVIASARRYI